MSHTQETRKETVDAFPQVPAILPPVVVGGVGGSGTRVVAAWLHALGVYLGSDLNASNDNLWYTLLFKQEDILTVTQDAFQERVAILTKGMTAGGPYTASQRATIRRLAAADRAQHQESWLQQRANSLLAAEPPAQTTWGWKEPNSHVVLDRLQEALPGMRYIHLARNGLDMAFSKNQNQLRLWGAHFLDTPFEVSPRFALKFWRRVHERVLALQATMGDRFLLLRFEDLCSDPGSEIRRLLSFIGQEATEARVRSLALLVNTPPSIHRYKRHDLHPFDLDDIAYVEQLGFETHLD